MATISRIRMAMPEKIRNSFLLSESQVGFFNGDQLQWKFSGNGFGYILIQKGNDLSLQRLFESTSCFSKI